MRGPLGRFHELTLPTTDIRASVEFYERLGFSQAETGDAWSHPYGVVTDGRIALGLHGGAARAQALTFVHPGVAEFAIELERRGVTLELNRTGAEVFHEICFSDPAGQRIAVIEARTYSPAARAAEVSELTKGKLMVARAAFRINLRRDWLEVFMRLNFKQPAFECNRFHSGAKLRLPRRPTWNPAGFSSKN